MVRSESAGWRTLSYFLPAPLLCSLSIIARKVAPAAAPLAPAFPNMNEKSRIRDSRKTAAAEAPGKDRAPPTARGPDFG